MSDDSNADLAYSTEKIITDGVETEHFKCNACDFSNTHKGGMKRHIAANHKVTGTKRPLTAQNEDEEKRPKLDEFAPDLASTQIELEEVLLMEEQEAEHGDSTVAGYSNQYLEKLGDLTAFQFEDMDTVSTSEKITEDVELIKLRADLNIANAKLVSLSSTVKEKELLLVEKGLALDQLTAENESNKETLARLQDDLKCKEDALEVNLAHANSLEVQLAAAKSHAESSNDKSEKRIKLLERALKKYMDKAKAATTNQPIECGHRDLIASKDTEIKTLRGEKVTLANLLQNAQEQVATNVKGSDSASTEKCTKLTNDLRSKVNELKAAEKDCNNLKLSVSKLQTDISALNVQVAKLEADNVKLNDFNNKMYEMCKKCGVFDKLEKEIVNVTDQDCKKYERYGNRPEQSKIDKKKEKCWYYENGFCRKGGNCSLTHPVAMCWSFWSTGECCNGTACESRHPVQVCSKYLNGACRAGNNCVHQHPQSVMVQSQATAHFSYPSSSNVVRQNSENQSGHPNQQSGQGWRQF